MQHATVERDEHGTTLLVTTSCHKFAIQTEIRVHLGGCNQNFDFPVETKSGASVCGSAAMVNVGQLFAVAVMEGMSPCVGS